jgi:hypothetical protein
MLILEKVRDHAAGILHAADVGSYLASSILYVIQFDHGRSSVPHDRVHVGIDLFHDRGCRVPH